MKWTFAIFVLIGVSSQAAFTCLNYFKIPYTREGALFQKPERLDQIKGVLAELNSVSRDQAYEAALEKFMLEASKDIQHHRAHIGNLKKLLKSERYNIELSQGLVFRLEDRIETLEKRHSIYLSKLGIIKRFLGVGIKTRKHKDALKQITQQLKDARKKREQRVLEHTAQLSEYERSSKPFLEKAIQANQNIIDALILEAKAKAEQFADNYAAGIATASKRLKSEANDIISEFVREWVLSQYELAVLAESYKEDISQRVCAAGTCQTIGSQILSDISIAQGALAKLTKTQRYAVIREVQFKPETKLRAYVSDVFTNLRFAERMMDRAELDAVEEIFLDSAIRIVKERKSLFSNLSKVESALIEMGTHLALAFKQVGDGQIRSNIAANELQERLAVFRVVISDLLAKVNDYKVRPYLSLKQYEVLVQLLVESSYQINFLLRTSGMVKQDLARFLDKDGLIQSELDQVEEILWHDFLQTQTSGN